MDYKEIECSSHEGIFTITLNRPAKHNAFTKNTLMELLDALDCADNDDDVRGIIVTGAGKTFCAGADLSEGSGTFDAGKEIPWGDKKMRDYAGQLALRLYDCIKPVVAAINGPAIGVGATMTLAMDFRFMSNNAALGFVFTRRGIVAEGCSTWFLPRLIGLSRALEWMYSGRLISAKEAMEAGLVYDVFQPENLLAQARAFLKKIIQNTSPVSVSLTRQMLWKMLSADHPMEAHKIESRGIYAMGRSFDGHEGVASFLEKRPPRFSMRPSKDMPDYFPWWRNREYS